MKTRYIRFKGEHEALVDGDSYTYRELAETIGATYTCIKERLYKKKYCTIDDLYPPYSKSGGQKGEKREETLLESKAMVISQEWLQRKLQCQQQ